MNNIKVDDTKDIDLVMLRYNSKEYSHNYLKTFGSLWQHYKDKPAAAIDISASSKFKQKQKLTLSRMVFFGAAHGWGAKRSRPCLKSVTHIL